MLWRLAAAQAFSDLDAGAGSGGAACVPGFNLAQAPSWTACCRLVRRGGAGCA